MPPNINRIMTPVEWGLLLLLSVLWGGAFFLQTVALRELTPLVLVVMRTGIAAIALAVVLRASGENFPATRPIWASFIGLGMLNNVLRMRPKDRQTTSVA